MARHLSIATTFRMTPPDLLEKFFIQELKHPLVEMWTGSRPDLANSIMEAMGKLPDATRDDLQVTIKRISALACQDGMKALLEAAELLGEENFAACLPKLGMYARSFWCFLNHVAIFDKAETAFQLESITWWRKRDCSPGLVSSNSKADREKFASALSDFLQASEDRGKRCTVESYDHQGKLYFLAYPDDYPSEHQVHTNKGLDRHILHATFTMAFAFDPARGTLEISAKVPKSHKPKLEELFAEHILGSSLKSWKEPVYQLDHLKYRSALLETDPLDGLSSHVTEIEMAMLNNPKNRIRIKVDPQLPPEYLYDLIRQQWKSNLEGYQVILVAIQNYFESREGNSAGRFKLLIKQNSHNLSKLERHPQRVSLLEKYLEIWNILQPASNQPVLATVGIGPPTWTNQQLRLFPDSFRKFLRTNHWIVPGPHQVWLNCPECGEATEVTNSKRADGSTRFSILCPACGISAVDSQDLCTWKVNTEALIAFLSQLVPSGGSCTAEQENV